MLKFWYTKCLHLTTNKKYINFLMRQAKVRDYYGAVILYNFFEHLNIIKWKNSKLESCRSHRGLQFSYKNHLHPMSYRRVMIFRRFSRNKLEKEKTKPRLLYQIRGHCGKSRPHSTMQAMQNRAGPGVNGFASSRG